MSFDESVREAFKDDNARKYAETYLTESLITWRDCEKSLSRITFTLVAVCITAALIYQGIASEASFAGIKITNFRVVQDFLPVIIAYLYSSLMSLAAESIMTQTAFSTVFAAFQPKLASIAHLRYALHPTGMTFSAGERIKGALPEKDIVRKIVELSADIRGLTLVLAPAAYEVYLFVILFQRAGFTNIGLWISLALSFALFASGFTGLFAAGSVPGPR